MGRGGSTDKLKRLFPALLMLACSPALRAQSTPQEPYAFLRKFAHFTESDLSALERGDAVGRILDASAPTEVPPVGAVLVRVRRDFFLEKYRDIESFKKSKEVLQIGRFHSPPRLEDLDALTLDSGDIDSLRKCQIGDCGLKMSAGMIERFRKEVNWSAPDHAAQATALFRRVLFDYVKDYLAQGNAALVTYEDKKAPVPLRDQSGALLQASPYLREYLPELHRHLLEFPKSPLSGAEGFVYWSKEKFGYKPVVSMTHVTIHKPARAPATSVVIASKQIYASHYFLGSLGLSACVEKEPSLQPTAVYLLYLNRSRVDLPQGFFSGVIRFFIRRRVRDGLETNLRLTKERLEAAYRAAAG